MFLGVIVRITFGLEWLETSTKLGHQMIKLVVLNLHIFFHNIYSFTKNIISAPFLPRQRHEAPVVVTLIGAFIGLIYADIEEATVRAMSKIAGYITNCSNCFFSKSPGSLYIIV